LAGATLPGHEITRIDSTAKLGPDFVLITLGNFGHSHLFRSQDGGKSWEDINLQFSKDAAAKETSRDVAWTPKGQQSASFDTFAFEFLFNF